MGGLCDFLVLLCQSLGGKEKTNLTKINIMTDETIHYQTLNVRGINIFYREAGPKDAPVILLMHGYPTSSFMFRNLIPILATKYRVIAPDLPGFGFSDAPDRSAFQYTF